MPNLVWLYALSEEEMSKVKLYSVPEANELIYAACIKTLNKAKAKRVKDIKQLQKVIHDEFALSGIDETNDMRLLLQSIDSVFAKYLEE
jgi:hypothetical protein